MENNRLGLVLSVEAQFGNGIISRVTTRSTITATPVLEK